MKLNMRTLPGQYAVHRFPAGATIPELPLSGDFLSITSTPEELSIVCPVSTPLRAQKTEVGWNCLQVEGPLDFGLTGILAELAGILARAEIAIFAISTYDTDYILVKKENLDRAREALRDAGHEVR